MFFFDDNSKDSKRTMGIRDKQILYKNAKGRCQNPACNKKIDFDEMQVGHKTAWSRGGSTTFKNSVCICYRCNKLQGTDSWAVFLKKQGIEVPEDPKKKIKRTLEGFSVTQLKLLASKCKVRVRGDTVENWFESHTKAPTKRQYITHLSKIATEKDIEVIKKLHIQPDCLKWSFYLLELPRRNFAVLFPTFLPSSNLCYNGANKYGVVHEYTD